MEGTEASEDAEATLERLQRDTPLYAWLNFEPILERQENPSGFTHQPTTGRSDENFIKWWGELFNKDFFDLMLLIIDQVSMETSTVKAEIMKHVHSSFHWALHKGHCLQIRREATQHQTEKGQTRHEGLLEKRDLPLGVQETCVFIPDIWNYTIKHGCAKDQECAPTHA